MKFSEEQYDNVVSAIEKSTDGESNTHFDTEVEINNLMVFVEGRVFRDYKEVELLPAGCGYPAQIGHEETSRSLDIRKITITDEDGEEIPSEIDINILEQKFERL